jgi:type I restriction-modification system DNA methylase subunit
MELTEKLAKLQELTEQFKTNIKQYKSLSYDEANTRVDFIDKFFELLDWDVRNTQGYSEDYREVVREDKVIIHGKPKAPDYSFRIGGIRKFFVEAKKPSVNIREEIDPAYQIRRYAYTAKLPLSILTDFEEFAVYDTRIKPDKADKASTARVFYCTYEEYEKNFDFICNTFSKEAILKGSFDLYVEKNKSKKGSSEVDKEFLKLISDWRESLAKNISLRNPQLEDVYQLNFAVQKIMDRIIFLRIAEDRGTEEYALLFEVVHRINAYQEMNKLFIKGNEKYNSDLFKADEFLTGLSIDDNVLKTIISEMYYPDCPYEFSVLPIEVLGNIYEQFLGKTIRLTEGHHAKIEEKPEVRKAGGVYYTPQYIVNYIVENTVGAMIGRLDSADKQGAVNSTTVMTPAEIEKIKILDPACGSGSFLIGAFNYLLNYYIQYYTYPPGKELKQLMRTSKSEEEAAQKWKQKWIKAGKIYEVRKNDYHLTIQEKQKILLNNIYGVDIDPQAVEVTKLSLLLKLMENESAESAGMLFKHSDTKYLPNLGNNIKCGNSLIGSDFYESEGSLFDKETIRSINAFDWSSAAGFQEIMKSGGFDVVIGNPPYIRIQGLQEYQPETIPYLKSKYRSASSGNIDIYVMFLEKALKLIKNNGSTGYILPHKFFQGDMGFNIRTIISEKSALKKVVHFGANQIFENATTYTCLLFMSSKSNQMFDYAKIESVENMPDSLKELNFIKLPVELSQKEKWHFHTDVKGELLEKLESMPLKLENITRKIFVGLQTSADKIYVLKSTNLDSGSSRILKLYSQTLEKEIEIEKGLVKPFLMGKDVKRYQEPVHNSYVIFPYLIENGKANLMSPKYIKEIFPLGWEYLHANKKELENRENGKMKHEEFYAYIYPKNLAEFDAIKIMTPEISYGCNMTVDNQGIYYHTTKVYSFVFDDNRPENRLYFLGILNSRLLWFFLQSTGYVLRGGFFTFKTQYLNPFPIRTIDFSIASEKAQHDKMVSLVDQMLASQKELQAAKTEQDKALFSQQGEILDRKIDRLVYELYGLTEEEIKVVEGR